MRAMSLPERIIALESKQTICDNTAKTSAALEIRLVAMEVVSRNHEESRKDVETRLRNIERAIYKATGAVCLLQVVLKYLL